MLWSLLYLIIFLLYFPREAAAAEYQPHYTLVINQVRGEECCDRGNLDFLKLQLNTLKGAGLPATFAVRYDALKDERYRQILTQAKSSSFEMAAWFEITPALASESGVTYQGNVQKWYEPGNLYLFGYPQTERAKLIDTYMARFKETFGETPETTVAWMIDAYSLRYLADKYQIRNHEITRDQWYTDKLTLYGGPVHYPYVPAVNWPFVPASGNNSLPVIIRQTISDPVDNYGDTTNSYTSQPNDFMGRTNNFSYFEFLFNQAHSQKLNDYTIAVVGLENSMAEPYQQMFIRQLDFIGRWQKADTGNLVIAARDFPFDREKPLFSVYEGRRENDAASRVWWINTPAYRLRLRLNKNRLFASDLRVYDDTLTDPYLTTPASSSAFWITPFITDASRLPDNLLEPVPDNGESSGIAIRDSVTGAEKYSLERENRQLTLYDDRHFPVGTFTPDWFDFPGRKPVPKNPAAGNPLFYAPQLSHDPVDQAKSFLYANNRYVFVRSNPARLIFYPRDAADTPAVARVAVRTKPEIDNITVDEQNDLYGGIIIDFNNPRPQKVEVTVTAGNSAFEETIYFSPDCSRELSACLRNPWYFWWYLLTLKRW